MLVKMSAELGTGARSFGMAAGIGKMSGDGVRWLPIHAPKVIVID